MRTGRSVRFPVLLAVCRQTDSHRVPQHGTRRSTCTSFPSWLGRSLAATARAGAGISPAASARRLGSAFPASPRREGRLWEPRFAFYLSGGLRSASASSACGGGYPRRRACTNAWSTRGAAKRDPQCPAAARARGPRELPPHSPLGGEPSATTLPPVQDGVSWVVLPKRTTGLRSGIFLPAILYIIAIGSF